VRRPTTLENKKCGCTGVIKGTKGPGDITLDEKPGGSEIVVEATLGGRVWGGGGAKRGGIVATELEV